MMVKCARLYVDDIFVCTMPLSMVDGMLKALHSKGTYNVRVKEEQKS